MKKIFTFVVLALLAIGCAKEYDDSGLRELIAGLDLRISELETSISSLQSTLGDGKYVRKVEEYKDPDTGRTTGITVTYTDGNIVHFNIVPTDPTQGPVFSVIRNGAGQLCWAVDGVIIKIDGEDVPVYETPSFSIDEDGNLIVEVNGQTANLGPVKSEGATLQDGIFTNLAVTDDAVVLTLADGTTVNIPFAEAFKLVIDKTEYVYAGSDPVEIPYTVTAKTGATVVGTYYDIDKFSVAVEADKIVVTPVVPKASGMILAYADSKVGLTSIVSLLVEAEGIRILDTPYSATVDYLVEGEDATLAANAVSNIPFSVKPVDSWIHLVSVKGQVYVINLKFDDNNTGAVREGKVNIVREGTEDVVQTLTIAQLPMPEEVGPKDLSRKGSANSYIVDIANAGGEYKFKAVKGNSEESVGSVASVEVLWETWNNGDEVTAGSVVASVAFADGYVSFQLPAEPHAGNAVIAAKDAAGVILWSWHVWAPSTAIETNTYGLLDKALMDRNLGALVAATAGETVSVESFGLTYQWGRKDPFVGAKRVNSGSNALVAGVELSVADGTITVAESIANPTLLGHTDDADWLPEPDNTLWADEGKTIYDPCPPGYRVPARDKTQPMFSGDLSALAGWAADTDNFYFKMGDPATVFPFAGYRDDYGVGSLTHAYDRAVIWTAHNDGDKKGYMLNVRGSGTHTLGSAPKARGGSVRCVAE